jgi:hypothetical protein
MRDCIEPPDAYRKCYECKEFFSTYNYGEMYCRECYNALEEGYYMDHEGGDTVYLLFPVPCNYPSVKFEGFEEKLHYLTSQYLPPIDMTKCRTHEIEPPHTTRFHSESSRFHGYIRLE